MTAPAATTTAIKERPIIFSSASVNAILAGNKIQTRRVVKPQPPAGFDRAVSMPLSTETSWCNDATREHWPTDQIWQRCPLGMPGERLWVREAWQVESGKEYTLTQPEYEGGQNQAHIEYRAVDPHPETAIWRSPIFMPRWASRINLEIANVRVERLQDITIADAIAEGIPQHMGQDGWPVFKGIESHEWDNRTSAENYLWCWDRLNAKRGYPAASNPWVWVITFRRIK